MNRRTDSAHIYATVHTHNLQKHNPGSVFDIKTTFSITVIQNFELNKYMLLDLLYISLKDAHKKYIDEECKVYPEPYQHIPVFRLDILKSRISSKILFRDTIDINIDEKDNKIKEYFQKFVEENINKEEINYLENMMHFDDNLLSDWIVPSELDLRKKAMEIISNSEVGSWLVRRSSVIEKPNVKVRVLTIKENNICHYLFAHIDGLGYVLTIASSGDSFPNIGENKTIIIIDTFSSLTSLLTFMQKQGLVLDRLVK